jgi:ribosomal protein S12
MRTKEIYEITKKEIANGQDIYEYIPIMYGLLKEEDYEALEGIRLAISDLGLQFEIPKTDYELDECMKFIDKQKGRTKNGL